VNQTGPKSHGWRVLFMLGLAVLAVSTSAILVRFAQAEVVGVDPLFGLFLAATRMVMASLILGLPAWHHRKAFSRAGVGSAMAAGVAFGLHFALWLSSLSYTSVASSVTLVTTTPLWVAVIGTTFFGKRHGRWVWIGSITAVLGAMMIGLSDAHTLGRNELLGDALALSGAIAIAFAFLFGQAAQTMGLSTLHYMTLSTLVAATVLVPLAWMAGVAPAQMPATVYGFVFLMALVPQLVGHGAIAWSLAHVAPTLVALAILFEPVVAGLMAWVLFDEKPGSIVLIGAAVVLVGVAIVVRASKKTTRRADDPSKTPLRQRSPHPPLPSEPQSPHKPMRPAKIE
jgi:drug/metabolite transporter (DMT)-like permease